jgi:hypothetical protein
MIRQSIREHPALYAVLLCAVAACLALWLLALRSLKKRRAAREALIAELERERALRREFAQPTRRQLIDAPPERLVEGLCARIQAQLEEQESLQAAYEALPEPQRLIYALGYVVQDGGENLSGFFKANGSPLTEAALEAALRFLDADAARIFQQEFDAFDERNETVSLLPETIDSLDAQWNSRKKEAGEAFYGEAKEFVLAFSDVFAGQEPPCAHSPSAQ